MYRISRSISRELFLTPCFRYKIRSEIAHDNDLGTKKSLN